MTDNAAELRRWAETHRDDTSAILAAVARHTLAHLPKTPTLADELRAPLGYNQEGIKHVAFSVGEVNRLADRAEQIEQERDDARAEVERLTAERVTDPSPTLNDGSMTRPATVAREENVAPDQQGDPLPAPADVPEGQAWIVKVDRTGPTVGFSTNGMGWVCYRPAHGIALPVGDERITLVSRLVPAPRQITTREELDALPYYSIIREPLDSEALQKDGNWYGAYCGELRPDDVPLPATVLWEPEVAK